MPPPRVTLIPTLLATAVALYYGVQQEVFKPSSVSTHCYQNIFSTTANCLNVDETTGTIVDIFSGKKGEGFVLPGFWDGHGHLTQYGEMLGSVKVYGVRSLGEIRSRLKDYVQTYPGVGTKDRWIRGIGWDQALFMEPGEMPTATDLVNSDPALQDLYIMLDRVDVHCIWVSPAIVWLLPSPLPEAPPGGSIPSEGVFCDNAIDMVKHYYPPPTAAVKKGFVQAAQKELVKYGIVGMHDAGVPIADINLYETLAEAGELVIRIYAMIGSERTNGARLDEARKIDREDGMLSVKGVKLFADGALGSWGAALINPYSDDDSTRGTLLVAPEKLKEMTSAWNSAGYQVHIHAIGDLANQVAIDAFEAASLLSPLLYPRIEHAQILTPEDQLRLKTFGIFPSIQPTHATSDMGYAEERLGEKRIQEEAYRMKTFFSLGLDPVLGSDFPVESPEPLRGIYSAVMRCDTESGCGDTQGWYREEEGIPIKDAIRGFTENVARSVGDTKAGSLDVGKWADWVVLSKDLVAEGFEGNKGREEWEGLVEETWIGGKRVYKKGENF